MILVHPRKFYDSYCFEIAWVVKLQIIIFPFENMTEVTIDKILHLRPQFIKPQI